MSKVSLNYAIILASYDIIFGSIWAYVTVYLLAQNFNESLIGIFIALANLLAVFLQPYLANLADKSVKWTLYHYTMMLLGPALVMILLIFFGDLHPWLVAIFYLVSMALLTASSPLLNSMAMVLVNNGHPINYGISRSVGSLSFGITSSAVGLAIVTFGNDAILMIGMAGLVTLIVGTTALDRFYLEPIFSHRHQEIKYNVSQIALQTSTRDFFKRYDKFLFLMIGSFFFFISQNIISYYFIQIVTNVGGNEAHMGFALTLAAFAEVPAMFFYSKFAQRFGHEKMLLTSSLFFLTRIGLMFLASNIYGVFFAQLMQSGGFGFYIIASVYYPNEIMESIDKVKGQAFLATSGTLGGVVGSLVGGFLTNYFNIKIALLFGVCSTTLGVVLYFYALYFSRRKLGKDSSN